MDWSRRKFIGVAGGAAVFHLSAHAAQVKITDVQTMTLTGPRTYVYVKVSADNGHFGIAEAPINQGCDILNPDLRNSGGFLETKRIADMADTFALPMATHNTGSQLHTWANCQWAASIRDYVACETITGMGGWMDQVLLLDGPYIKNGFIAVTDKPGLGADLNPDVVKAHLAVGEQWWG